MLLLKSEVPIGPTSKVIIINNKILILILIHYIRLVGINVLVLILYVKP